MLLINKNILATLLFSTCPITLFCLNKYRSEEQTYKLFVHYNGQADVLLSLQIYPDYYPYQFKQKTLYNYLTDSTQYIVSNTHASSEKQSIHSSFQKRINELLGNITTFGPTLWDKAIYDSGTVYRNDQFWNSKKTNYLFLERFISDDYENIFDSFNHLPKHEKLIITNYRVARDPYSVFSKEVFEYFKEKKNVNASSTDNTKTTTTDNKLAASLYDYCKAYSQVSRNSLKRFCQFFDFWNEHMSEDAVAGSSTTSPAYKLFDEKSNLFDPTNATNDLALARKYQEAIFSSEEKKLLNQWHKAATSGSASWKMNYIVEKEKQVKTTKTDKKSSNNNNQDIVKYQPSQVVNFHHPSLEHQPVKGSAPISEGSQKDVMIFLHQFAKILDKISKSDSFEKDFEGDPRKVFIKNALNNYLLIKDNYDARIKNIRKYFQKIGVVDNSYDPDKNTYTKTNSKTIAFITYPPLSVGNTGDGSIQSISKLPFIYSDIGLKQFMPKLDDEHNGHSHAPGDDSHEDCENDDVISDDDVFSIDDNGWWWKLGDTSIKKNNFAKFEGKADSIVFLASKDDWNILHGGKNPKINNLFTLLKREEKDSINARFDYEKINTPGYKFAYNQYHLWNEGLRSPITLNLVLDNLVEIIKNQFVVDSAESSLTEYKAALDWGSYWSTNFIGGTSTKQAPTVSKP